MKLIRRNTPFLYRRYDIPGNDSVYFRTAAFSSPHRKPCFVFVGPEIPFFNERMSGMGNSFRRAVQKYKNNVKEVIAALQRTVDELPDMPAKDEDIEIVDGDISDNREDDEDYEDDVEIEERGK